MAVMRPCPEPGCTEIVDRGRCEQHARNRNRLKAAQPHREVYRSSKWLACRRAALRSAGYRCQAIDRGLRCPAEHPQGRGLHGHHDYPGGVVRMLADGVSPFDPKLVIILCDEHHGRVEALLRGGRSRRL